MTATSFERALKFVLQWEGGYSNHAADRGGETNRGITHATYDNYRLQKGLSTRSVRLLEQNELEDIYRSLYWSPAGCDLLPSNLALVHFDWAVNAGVGRAVRMLQKVVNVADDGIIGPRTKAAIATCLKARGEAALVDTYCSLRENKYRNWGTGSQRVFLSGWLNRLAALRSQVG